MSILKKTICIALLVHGAFVVADNPSVSPEHFTGIQPKPLVYGRHDMIVTNNPWASKAASDILKQGGNAVDAAVAAAFVLGLVEPASSGLGGGGFALTYDKSTKQLTAYDGRETAPKSATPELFMDAKGQPLPFEKAMLSYKSVGVPAEVALLHKIHREQGKLTWSTVVKPAINLARQGFPLSKRLHDLLAIDQDSLINDPAVKSIYFLNNGQVKPINTIIKNSAYAKSLSIIAKDPREFYTGKLARDIVAKINHAAGHSVYTLADISNYSPHESNALCSDYRTNQVCSTPFASGGVTVLELMKIYANTYSGKNFSDLNRVSHFLDASKLAYADRHQYIADPRFVRQPLQGLLDKEYLVQRSKLVTDNPLKTPAPAGIPKGADPRYAPDAIPREHGTTSIAIVDKQGNAVSMTLTIEHQFGSHLFVDGFFLNNELTDFSFLPDDNHSKPVANRVEPLKRPRSAIAPVMAFDKQGDLIVISGSPGGSQIICYVAKSLIQMLDFNRNPAESSASGNLCALNDTPQIESDSELSGLSFGENKVSLSVLLSGIVNIKRAPQGGWYGAADPRREGEAIGG